MLKIKDFDWNYVDLNIYSDIERSEILVDNSMIYNEIRKYDERNIYREIGIQEMQVIYTDFCYNWVNVFKALNINYKPLENYNMVENNNEYFIKDKEKIHHAGIDTQTDYTTTFDNTAFRNDTQTESDIADVETIYENTKTDENNISSNEIRKFKNEKFGNLGVTTSQQMLQSEIDIRIKNYIKMFVKAFVNEIAFYV